MSSASSRLSHARCPAPGPGATRPRRAAALAPLQAQARDNPGPEAADGASSSNSAASQPAGRGPQGLNVEGYRPTSPAGWQLMKERMQAAGVRVVPPQEVGFARQRGEVVVDIRPAADYEAGHVPGAVSVPLYRPIQGWSPFQVVRRIGYAAFGVINGTEANPNFLAEVGAAVPDPGKPVILYCNQGGSLEPVEGSASKKGFQTRSLVAAHELVASGAYAQVAVMRGGFREWALSGREVEEAPPPEQQGQQGQREAS